MKINKDKCKLHTALAWSMTAAVVADVQDG